MTARSSSIPTAAWSTRSLSARVRALWQDRSSSGWTARRCGQNSALSRTSCRNLPDARPGWSPNATGRRSCAFRRTSWTLRPRRPRLRPSWMGKAACFRRAMQRWPTSARFWRGGSTRSPHNRTASPRKVPRFPPSLTLSNKSLPRSRGFWTRAWHRQARSLRCSANRRGCRVSWASLRPTAPGPKARSPRSRSRLQALPPAAARKPRPNCARPARRCWNWPSVAAR